MPIYAEINPETFFFVISTIHSSSRPRDNYYRASLYIKNKGETNLLKGT